MGCSTPEMKIHNRPPPDFPPLVEGGLTAKRSGGLAVSQYAYLNTGCIFTVKI